MVVLFVCTGNTCRSAMAVAIARQEIESRGLHELEVDSAGIDATDGEPATPDAIEVAADHGLNLDDHRSKQLTLELLATADRVVVMERWQHAEVIFLEPEAEVTCLAIDDPFGRGCAAYARTWEELETLIPQVLEPERVTS